MAFVFALCFCQQVIAQNEVLDDVNGQLRSYFAPLSRPANNYRFLYDMAAHQTDSVFFQTSCPQPNVTDAWYRVYEEMYHTAYDTTQFISPETVFSRGKDFYNDIIPIGIMRFSHYVLKPDAMTTNTYFDFDTVNNILRDKPGRPSDPYLNSGIFMAAPTVAQCRHRNPIFRIDPQLIFYDATNAGVFNGNNLQIDFGDGNGYIRFDPGQVTNYEVNYADSGEHQITVTLGSKYYPTVSSISVIGTGLTLRPTPPDLIITDYPGIRAGFYGACNATRNSGKLVIYVSGIDLMDPFDNVPGLKSAQRTVEEIYEEMIHKDRIVQLKNDGYNFLVVDWERSNIDIRFNALYLVNLMHHLKCDLDPNDNQQFVVIAESLGGIASRYALTYMETQDYLQGNGAVFFQDEKDPNNSFYLQQHPGIYAIPRTWTRACNPAKMHNTRLFMTLDSPHQGANIPISLQLAYNGILQTIDRFVPFSVNRFAIRHNLFLNAQASQQLLIYHYSTKMGTGMYKSYTSAPEKDRFFSQLQNLGNYPKYAKVMLISDGALDGQGQIDINTGGVRTPNDRFLDFKTGIYGKILGIRLPFFKANLELRSNPSGPGQVVQYDAGTYVIKIKLKWFGIRISNNYNPFTEIKEGTTNVLPFCTNAGGLNGIKPRHIGATPPPTTVSGTWVGVRQDDGILSEFLNLYAYKDASGCTNGGGYVGVNGLASINFGYQLCSDGMHFNFIPVQSALDYGTVNPYYTNPALGHDIEADPITDKLNTYMNPAVDVIMGWASTSESFLQSGNRNYPHLVWRNDGIFNLTGTANTMQHPNTYFSCRGTSDVTERGIINMEIGDEELYVENRDLPWTGEYQTEYIIRVNERNPHYIYLNQPYVLNSPTLNGIYSRSADFTTIQNPFNGSQGFARFLTDGTNTPLSNLPSFEIGSGTTFPNHNSITTAVLPICCQNYLAARHTAQQPPKSKTATQQPTQDSYLNLYPNPATGKQLTLEYLMPGHSPVQATIYSLTGQPVLQRTIPAYVKGLTVQHYQLPLKELPTGMYLLQLTNGWQTLQSKLIINH